MSAIGMVTSLVMLLRQKTKTEFVSFLTVVSDLVCSWPTVGMRMEP